MLEAREFQPSLHKTIHQLRTKKRRLVMKIILKTKIKATSNNSNIRSLDKYKLNPEPN